MNDVPAGLCSSPGFTNPAAVLRMRPPYEEEA